MLDIKYIREHEEEVQKNCYDRSVRVEIKDLLQVDQGRLALIQEVEGLRQERNTIAEQMKSASDEQRPGLIEKGKSLKELLAVKEAQLAEVEQRWMERMMQVPNLTHPDAPFGQTDEENKEIRKYLDPPVIDQPKSHVEIGKELEILDFERAAEVVGNKFYYLKGKLAILEQALIRFALDEAMEQGYQPITTPDLARDEVMSGTGFMPRGNESQIYSIENQQLSLIATAEIPLAGYHMNQTLTEDQLPIRYVGFSHCYRTEAGAYGRESYGLYRVHQFSKVELFVFAAPNQSDAIHEEMLRIEEQLWQKLEIPYRVVDICTGDLGGPAYRKYDIEAWMPGKVTDNDARGSYGEVTSASNCTDFQSRRLGIRMKQKDGTNVYAHTLNGTALATSRAMIAILENGQRPDGTIVVPKALVPYTGFATLN
ncbi:serine--tRNA ligase [Candidatus Uhrbacteria bacterium]|nr:serine--tRNA ligase [Candidatus Uhrbacteria bacterium]MBD3283839.1 serine--tRNA ligase [Candidatus Uhrbacteria bacterium]